MESRIDEYPRNQLSATVPHAGEVDLGFGDPPRPFRGFGVRVRLEILRAIASISGASKGSERTGTFKPCRNAFCAARAFPPGTSARCSILHWRDWRAVGGRWSRGRASAHFAGFDVSELCILDLVDRSTHAAAQRFAVTIDLAKRVVPARLGARQHAVEPFEAIYSFSREFSPSPRRWSDRLWLEQRRLFSGVFVSGRPLRSELPGVEGTGPRAVT